MAVFVPELTRTSPRSTGEAKVLRWLTRLDDDWHVLHSVGVLRHSTKAWAEADVVLVGPPGVLVLEVKGGRVGRRNGLWTFTDRAGRTQTRTEGPFDQAGGASAALHRSLLDAGALGHDQAMGYGVAFPDAELRTAAPPDILADVMLDAGGDWSQPARTLTRWLAYWRTRQGFASGCDRATRSAVVAALRGDLDLPEPLAGQIDALHLLQRAETERQLEVCRAGLTNRRVIFRCPPASGGHLLAVQTYLELESALPSPDLVVTDPDLSGWVRETFDMPSGGPGGLEASISTVRTQVILSTGSAAAVGAVERGDVEARSSCLHFVVDPVVADDPSLREGVTSILLSPCRTTKEIAVFGSLLARQLVDSRRLPAGQAVRTNWYDDEHDAIRLVKERVAELAEDLDPDRLLILLGRRSATLSELFRAVLPPGYEAVPVLSATDRSVPEADAVIPVLDAADSQEAYFLPALLRARAVLHPVLHTGLRGTLDEGGVWYGHQIRRRIGEPSLLSEI